MGMYVSKTMRLTIFLTQEGHNIIKEQPDRYNEKYKVWLFEDSIELRIALEKYKRLKKDK